VSGIERDHEPRAISVQRADVRHRVHARVGDGVRTTKDTGLDHFPSQSWQVNQALCAAITIAVDLLCWLRLYALAATQPGHRRAENPALPATARTSPAHPRPRYRWATPTPYLTVGHRPRPSVRPHPPPTPTRDLSSTSAPHDQETASTCAVRCVELTRPSAASS
jgi:hypothetical protein